MVQFVQATKEQTRLRMAAFGPSGSGKTFSALRIASGIVAQEGGKIAVIDTERRTARKYSDRFEFMVCDLDRRTIDDYVQAIQAAADAGATVLIIDSLTHAWHELLQEVNTLARARFGGNTWAAWSEGTPKQQQLVDSLLSFPGHIIATMRSKTEWVIQQNERSGKSAPTRVGLAPEQGKGIEYEFDILLELSIDHVANIAKDRSGRFQDKVIELPDEDFGRELSLWLQDAPAPAAQVAPDSAENARPAVDQALEHQQLLGELQRRIEQHSLEDSVDRWCEHFGAERMSDLTPENVRSILDQINKRYEPK